MFKKKLRRTPVSSLYDVANVCDKSTGNVAVLVGSHDKQINVPTYDWTEHFDKKLKFKTIDNILEYHHFRMSSKEPGIVYCSRKLSDVAVKVSIIGNVPVTNDLPCIVQPKGFTKQRKEYLYTDIRDFCTEETKDLTAPDPAQY